MKTKLCIKCKKRKKIVAFSKKNSNKSGINNKCKKCQSQYATDLSHKNSNRVLIITPKSKICGKCKKSKNAKYFSKNRCKSDGLCGYCKLCDTKKAGMLREKYRNKQNVISISDKKCLKCDTYKKSNMFAKNKNRKDWLNFYCKKCTATIMAVQNARRRALKYKLKENFNRNDMYIVLQACNNMCIKCGTHNDLSIDHFRPLSKLNALYIGNAIILCKSCNSKKYNKLPEDFFSDEEYQTALASIAVSSILKYGVG